MASCCTFWVGWGAWIVASVQGTDRFGFQQPVVGSHGDEGEWAGGGSVPLRSAQTKQPQQRPSGAASAASTAVDVDSDSESSSASPKVVLRPRTRQRLEEESLLIDDRLSDAGITQQPTPKKLSGYASIPMVHARAVIEPSEGRVDGNKSTLEKNRPPKAVDHQVQKRFEGKTDFVEARRDEADFLLWCKQVLGISTILEIQSFPYDFQTTTNSKKTNWESDMIQSSTNSSSAFTTTTTTLTTAVPTVRGLAAGRDIAIGEIVIRVPMQALFSVATSIDQDPVLSRVMGPELRKDFGWDDLNPIMKPPSTANKNSSHVDGDIEDDDEEMHFFELPLLAVALLHHRRLGASSPIAPYIRILKRTPVDTMPFLWSAQRLQEPTVSEGVRIVARGIREEIKTMYDRVVRVLIRRYPDVFGEVVPNTGSNEEWMFSYEMFQWAFAIVNSRHWQLPIEDLTSTGSAKENHRHHHQYVQPASTPSVALEDQLPPAQKPTGSWVSEHGDIDVDDDTANSVLNEDVSKTTAAQGIVSDEQDSHDFLSNALHSFLAPVADLLNFGPPCTRVNYDRNSHSFEIVASCSFRKGEEVTFWYSNECDDVMMGVYGFSHSLIPPCKSSEEWRQRATLVEEQLKLAIDNLKMLEEELEFLEAQLKACDRHDSDEKEKNGHNTRLRHEEPTRRVTADSPTSSSRKEVSRRSRARQRPERSRVRRIWSQKTEF